MKYFTIKELSASLTAERNGIINTPHDEAVAKMETLIEKLLDPIRELWGKPLRVTSGYRCKKLNKAVGGAKNSQHLRGEAADITTGNRVDNRCLMSSIIESSLDFDQLIDESDCLWLHISYNATKNRREILTIS